MKAPQIIFIVISAVGLLAAANRHGQQGKHSFWTTLLGAVITYSLLIWGGFFS